MDSISNIAERYLRAARGEMDASPELLRRNLLVKFEQLSDAEKMKMYRENMGADNPLLKLVEDCSSDDEAWERIQLVEQTFLGAMRDVFIAIENEKQRGDLAGDTVRRTQVALIIKTVLPQDTWVELAPAVA